MALGRTLQPLCGQVNVFEVFQVLEDGLANIKSLFLARFSRRFSISGSSRMASTL